MSNEATSVRDDDSPSRRSWAIGAPLSLAVMVGFGGYLRLRGLGLRSLWQDEFSTWHAARLPFVESLCWQPELNIPPLYQLCLRFVSDVNVASEAVLRAPAAVFGILGIVAMAWLAGQLDGWRVALAAAMLAACHSLQIRYSQEVRPYTLWLLLSTVSMGCWQALATRRHTRKGKAPLWIVYVLVTALAFHAHYLTGLVLVAQALWLFVIPGGPRAHAGWNVCLGALAAVGVLCAPITLHFVFAKTQVLQGLGWVPSIGTRAVLGEFSRSSYGAVFLVLVLLPSIGLWAFARAGGGGRLIGKSGKNVATGPGDPIGLLLVWLAVFWVGLPAISLAGHPLLVSRYLLPATVPAMLIPLLVARRLDRRLPIGLALVFCIQAAPQWVMQSAEYEPGFREMVAFLDEHVDTKKERVALAVDMKSYPNQEALERVAFDYYPTRGIDVDYVALGAEGLPADPEAFSDPRATYLILFGSDPGAILTAIDRKAEPIVLEGEAYPQLRFDPRRVIRISAKPR